MIPDGVSEVAIGILAGIIGFLFRMASDVRSRLAVVEARHEIKDADVKRLEIKIDKIDDKLDRLALRVASGNTINTAEEEG